MHAQLTNYAADKGIRIADSATCYLTGPTALAPSTAAPASSFPAANTPRIPWTHFLQQLNDNPRAHLFWMTLGLRNDSDSSLDCSLQYGELDYIDVWSPGIPDGHLQAGTLRPPPAGASYLQRQSRMLPIHLPAHSTTRFIVRIRQRTDEYSFDGLAIYDPDTLNASFTDNLAQERSWLIIQMLFQGFLLCQLIYALFQWLIIRRPEYGYYLLYMTLIALYFLSKQEYLFGAPILFTRVPLLRIWFGKTLLILPYFVYFRFIRAFLDLPANFPRLNYWIIRLEYFLLAYAAFDLVFILTTFDRKTQTLLYTSVFAAIFLLTIGFMIYLYRHRQTLIYYIISGSLFVATGHTSGSSSATWRLVATWTLASPIS